ncbi:MAG TPA: hypothetical protein PKO16_03685, partial [Bacteroidia bacterium]|nr:hypothetical protein [Bacteroidia bacterium]
LMLDNAKAKRLAEYCDLRLSLNHTSINQDDINNIYRFKWSDDLVVQQRAKAQDLVYAYMIDIHQKKYNDALTKLYTIFENGFKLWVDKHAGIETSQYFQNDFNMQGNKNQQWIEFIKNKFSGDLLKELEDRKVSLNNPNAMCYYYICKYGLAGNLATGFPLTRADVDKIFRVLSDLRIFRNKINHNLGSVVWEDIFKVLKKNNITYERFKQQLNLLTETQADFGMYKTIRDELLMKYTDQHL